MNKKYNVFPNLIKCRELLKYTQSDMAAYIGIGKETYKKKERGEFDFKLMEMLAVQETINDNLQTNLTLDELFKMEKIV
jgi:DNA-binding helix-turn-helix protein|nr:MAG TPA: antitoxin [Caudoviricetes sp.]